MTTIFVSPRIRTLTQVARYTRNGRVPDAAFHTELIGLANSAAAYRGKEVFRSVGSIADCPAQTSGSRTRHRFAFHTGPFTKGVAALFLLAPMYDAATDNAYVTLALTDVSGTPIDDASWHSSSSPTGSMSANDVPDNFEIGYVEIPVDPDTTYYAYTADVDRGRILGVVVYEVLLVPDTANGYTDAGVVGNGPIMSAHREALVAQLVAQWKRGASQVLNWCTETDAGARTFVAVAADRNIVDNTATTVTTATPGFTVDLVGKSTLSGSGVAVNFAAYGGRSGAAGVSGVRVKDSTGATVASFTGVPASAGWFTGTLTLPATKAKYDLQGFSAATGGTFTLYAVSLYEYVT